MRLDYKYTFVINLFLFVYHLILFYWTLYRSDLICFSNLDTRCRCLVTEKVKQLLAWIHFGFRVYILFIWNFQMTSSDKDFRFMATNDLMSELQKDSIKLDDDSERKVVRMLLRLLEDKNGEVQNLAVRWSVFYWSTTLAPQQISDKKLVFLK